MQKINQFIRFNLFIIIRWWPMERMREKKIQGKSEETETNNKMGEGDNI